MLQTEALMVLVLGFALALIAAMLLSRFIWNVGQRISRSRIEKAKPDLIRDLEADRDQLRASQAMVSRKYLTQIETLKAELVTHDAEVSRHRNRVQAMVTDANVHRNLINELEAKVADLTQHGELLENAVAQRDTQIENLFEEITERNNEIVKREGEIATRNAEITRLTSELSNMSTLFDKSNTQLRQIEADLGNAMNRSEEVSRRHTDAVRELAAERERNAAISAQAEYARNYTQPTHEQQIVQSVRAHRPVESPTGGSPDLLLTRPQSTDHPDIAQPQATDADVALMMQAARRTLRQSQQQIDGEKPQRPAVANVVAIAQRLRAQKEE
jgi:chromosome segregation ATPase